MSRLGGARRGAAAACVCARARPAARLPACRRRAAAAAAALCCAAAAAARARTGLLNEVIYAEEAQWEPLLRGGAAGGGVAEAAFMEALQRKMEVTVLGMQSGSYAQRVQAEFLKELEARAKAVYRALAAGGGEA